MLMTEFLDRIQERTEQQNDYLLTYEEINKIHSFQHTGWIIDPKNAAEIASIQIQLANILLRHALTARCYKIED